MACDHIATDLYMQHKLLKEIQLKTASYLLISLFSFKRFVDIILMMQEKQQQHHEYRGNHWDKITGRTFSVHGTNEQSLN